MMNRRNVLTSLAVAAAAVPLARLFVGGRAAADNDTGAASAAADASLDKLELSPAQWKQRLSPQEFDVLRNEATEAPNSSPLNREKRAGTFVCAGCALPLFKSEWKFESGTGWPSFWDHIEGHLQTRKDYKLIWPRTEYHCARCGGHQGHVFDDGPEPTGQRWCNNGVALDFQPASPTG